MILYLLKSTAALGILWGIYKLFLEREKLHVFNRFYLLASIVFAFSIPLINIEISSSALNNVPLLAKTLEAQPALPYDAKPVDAIIIRPATLWPEYLIITIGLVSVFFLVRFVYNLISIFKKIKSNTTIKWQGATLVLLAYNTLPYTFLNYIFISKAHYDGANIEPELFSHELAHVRQKHSFDVLLLEILRIVFWFNPLLYMYRQAIQLNHEFLADEAVNTTYQDVRAYQYLLLSKASEASGLSLTSNLNFQITKKRLLMMTKITSASTAFVKKAICAPLFMALGFYLTNFQLLAQEPIELKLDPPTITLTLKPHVLTKEDVNYQNGTILIRREGIFPEHKKYSDLTEAEKNMPMKVVYLEREVPTQQEMEKWQDAKMYGVWLNGKRIANSELAKYKASNIANYFNSKLMKNAINYGKHYFQINLMTNDYYEKVYLEGVKKDPVLFLNPKEN